MSKYHHLRATRTTILHKHDPSSAKSVPQRDHADEVTNRNAARIGELQDVLYASGHRSILIILQGMDASGKDGTVRRVFDSVNPEGINVTSFKSPTSLEARHDFLWRTHMSVPPRGIIGIFNRSYYEEVLIVRVHADRFLPPELRKRKTLWQDRYNLMNDFEHLLTLNGTQVLKFFLRISKKEQRERFESRQKDPTKHWKLAEGDFAERAFWDEYQVAYEKMLQHTSTAENPWYIIPADRKWVRNYWIANIVRDSLENMKLRFPPASDPRLITRKFK